MRYKANERAWRRFGGRNFAASLDKISGVSGSFCKESLASDLFNPSQVFCTKLLLATSSVPTKLCTHLRLWSADCTDAKEPPAMSSKNRATSVEDGDVMLSSFFVLAHVTHR